MNDEGWQRLLAVSKRSLIAWMRKHKRSTPTKPFILIRLLKILLIPLVLVVGILTLLFSYLASFVWDPDKHRKTSKKLRVFSVFYFTNNKSEREVSYGGYHRKIKEYKLF